MSTKDFSNKQICNEKRKSSDRYRNINLCQGNEKTNNEIVQNKSKTIEKDNQIFEGNVKESGHYSKQLSNENSAVHKLSNVLEQLNLHSNDKSVDKREKNHNNGNSSTLSLHITAYENSIKAKTSKKSSDCLKIVKSAKEISKKEYFSLPRYQIEDDKNHELMPFLISRRILFDRVDVISPLLSQAETFGDWRARVWSLLDNLSTNLKYQKQEEFIPPIFTTDVLMSFGERIMPVFESTLHDLPKFIMQPSYIFMNRADFDPRGMQNSGRDVDDFFLDMADLYYSQRTNFGMLFVRGGAHEPDIVAKRNAAWDFIYAVLSKKHQLKQLKSLKARWHKFVKDTLAKHVECTAPGGPSRRFSAAERTVIRYTPPEALHGIGARDVGVPGDLPPITSPSRGRMVNSETEELSQRPRRNTRPPPIYSPDPPRNAHEFTPESVRAALATVSHSSGSWSRAARDEAEKDPDFQLAGQRSSQKRSASQQQQQYSGGNGTSTKRRRMGDGERLAEEEQENGETVVQRVSALSPQSNNRFFVDQNDDEDSEPPNELFNERPISVSSSAATSRPQSVSRPVSVTSSAATSRPQSVSRPVSVTSSAATSRPQSVSRPVSVTSSAATSRPQSVSRPVSVTSSAATPKPRDSSADAVHNIPLSRTSSVSIHHRQALSDLANFDFMERPASVPANDENVDGFGDINGHMDTNDGNLNGFGGDGHMDTNDGNVNGFGGDGDMGINDENDGTLGDIRRQNNDQAPVIDDRHSERLSPLFDDDSSVDGYGNYTTGPATRSAPSRSQFWRRAYQVQEQHAATSKALNEAAEMLKKNIQDSGTAETSLIKIYQKKLKAETKEAKIKLQMAQIDLARKKREEQEAEVARKGRLLFSSEKNLTSADILKEIKDLRIIKQQQLAQLRQIEQLQQVHQTAEQNFENFVASTVHATAHNFYAKFPQARRIRHFQIRRRFSHEALEEATGFSKREWKHLLRYIGPDLQRETARSFAMNPSQITISALRSLRTGDELQDCGAFVGISEASACRARQQFCASVVKRMHHFITLDDSEAQWRHHAETMWNMFGIPYAVGAVDGTLVRIQSQQDRNLYVSRKGKPAINCQIFMDPDRFIRFLSCNAPGSWHDVRAFNASRLAQYVHQGWMPFEGACALADKGYIGIKEFLLPIPKRYPREEALFWGRHRRARRFIENGFADLKNSFRILRKAHSSINTSTLKSDPDGQQVIPTDAIPRTLKQEPGFESNVSGNVPSPSEARQIKQETRNSSIYVNQHQSRAVNSSGTENVAVKQKSDFESNVAGNVPPSTLTTPARQIKQEARNSTVESCANQYQSPTVASSGAETVAVKRKTLSNPQRNEFLPSSTVRSNIPGSTGYDRKSYDFFTGAFIREINTQKYNDMKSNLIHRITVAKLMLPFEDPLLFEKLFFLRQNIKHNPYLKDFFPKSYYCQNCQKDLQYVKSVVRHTFTDQHMCTALTQDELDKLIEAVSVIDYSYYGHFFTTKKVKVKKVKPPKAKVSSAEAVNRPRLPDTLNVAANGEYEFFTNQFYPKKHFDRFKRHLIHRIIEANLKLPFNDPLFIEKILFLRSNFNYRRAPKMKEVFGQVNEFCENCNKNFSGNFLDRLGHQLKNEHICLSLTQDELNKLYEVLTEIDYSADGFYFKKVGCEPKKRKNDHQNSNKNAKQQKVG